MVAAATDSRTGEAIDSSTASSPGVAYADGREKEKETERERGERERERERVRERERERDSQSENLHPCGGQAEGATVFTLSTDGSEFSPLPAVVFLFILDLRDLGIVALCVCACVRVRACVCVCVCSCFDFILRRVGKSNEQFSFRHLR